jgi:hypothetical protein
MLNARSSSEVFLIVLSITNKTIQWQQVVANYILIYIMEEPHQRVQSGKLRLAPKKNFGTFASQSSQTQNIVYLSLQNASDLEVPNIDDSHDAYTQSPTSLSPIQCELLQKIASGYGIAPEIAIDPDWRRTWNIGTWCIGGQVSLSINLMQPNIASSWVGINIGKDNRLMSIIDKYNELNLSKSKCRKTDTSYGCQLQGRWAIVVADRLISDGIIKKEDIDIQSLNITQSRLFCWLIVGNKSKYYCTFTKESIDVLVKYIPDWCSSMTEATAAQNTTFRLKNPVNSNDSTQLSITTQGWMQNTGKSTNLTKLHEAISIAFKDMVKSVYLKSFIDSLQFQLVPESF